MKKTPEDLCAEYEKNPKKLTLGEKFLCTILSPFMYNLSRWEGGSDRPSYFRILKDIWTNKV